jgi:2-polyprenyl-6-methoxyphenol hydroxylase-like FAD-dependent oxidoreductase
MAELGREHHVGAGIVRRQRRARSAAAPADHEDVDFEMRIFQIQGNPLQTRGRFEQIHQHRVVALGNAAQTLHPVAGQGFNLGVRDCFTLADELGGAAAVTDALASYARRRQADRAAIAALTGVLPALFASRFAPLAVARGLGLALLDAAAPLRRQLAQLLMFGVRS